MPFMIITWDLFNPNNFAIVLINSLFAFPSIAGAFISILIVPSSDTPTTFDSGLFL
jgi:hypothetical protein